MPLTRPLTFATRGFQILFAVVVLALSITALKWQTYNHPPAATGYAAFVGAFCLLIGIVGITATFVPELEKPILFGDVLAAALSLAGGMAWAIQLKGVDCSGTKNNKAIYNKLINGGLQKSDALGDYYGFQLADDPTKELIKRCKMAEANTAFLFLSFVAAIGAVVLGVLAVRRAKMRYGTSSGV